ncbi:hypothetical protein [Streptomyces sp. NPDC006335]|uniref:hypothetical protein n=1 Tax=Streptomyces sp. NPDC006335 TaxID=3156895 RepID=UPI0033AE5D13
MSRLVWESGWVGPVPIGGARVVVGFAGLVDGLLDAPAGARLGVVDGEGAL